MKKSVIDLVTEQSQKLKIDAFTEKSVLKSMRNNTMLANIEYRTNTPKFKTSNRII